MAIKRKQQVKSGETLLDLTQAKENATTYFERNQTLILGVLAGLVILIGGWFAYQNLVVKPKEERAIAQMWMAQVQFEQDSFQVALENPGGGYSGFLTIIKDFGGTRAGNLAHYYAGASYLNLGRFDDAVSHLNKFKPDGLIGPVLKHGTLGDAYSELNEMDKALTHYKKAADASDNELLTPYYLKKYALLSETQGHMEKAIEVYKSIKSKYPNSNEALSIDKYIARAERK